MQSQPAARGAWRDFELPPKARLPLAVALAILTGLGLTFVSVLITTQSLHASLLWLIEKPLATIGAAIFLGLLTAALGFLTRSLFAGGAVVSVLVLAASFVNYFKMLITSTPFFLSDIGLIGKVGSIAKLNSESISFSRNSLLAIAFAVVWLVVLFLLSRRVRPGWKSGLIAAGVSILAFGGLFGIRQAAEVWLYKPTGVSFEQNIGQAAVNGEVGLPLGLWRSALTLWRDSGSFADSDRDEMLALAQGYIDEVPEGGSDEKPNVIMILSESFFDVTKLPGVTYDKDPVADYHAAQSAGVSGTFFTRTLGYGTCNIELEILTGINNRYLPSDEMLCYWSGEKFGALPAVPELFSQNGYYTAFLHTFDDSIYNRSAIYPHLGFEDMYFSGDFAKIDPEAAAAEDYWAYLSQKTAGGFYSDDYMADLFIDLYEQKAPESPVFLYGASMENHTPYAADKYNNYDYPFTADLGAEAEGVLNALTQGVADASKSLGKLVEYFSGVEEPTIIVFFGDHRPGLPLESGGTLYSALGMCGEEAGQWSLNETAELYSTDYLIWANDPTLLPAEAGERENSSSAFLGLSALRAAGIPLDQYWRMIASTSESWTAYTWSYFVNLAGEVRSTFSKGLDEEDQLKLDVMTWLMREAVYGGETRAAFYDLK